MKKTVFPAALLFAIPAFAQQAQPATQSTAQSAVSPAQSTQNSGIVTHALIPVPVTEPERSLRGGCIYADKRYTEGAVIHPEGVALTCAPRPQPEGSVHAGPRELVWQALPLRQPAVRAKQRARSLSE